MSTHRFALPPGTQLRHYVIEGLLGHGGFGLTYKAKDLQLDREVAIKELFPTEFAIRDHDSTTVVLRSSDQEVNFGWAKSRFLEEARTLAALDDPGILRVHDFFEGNGTAYMVAQFIEGESLEAMLRRTGPPPEAQLKSYLVDVLTSLGIVHNLRFLHRDIKTENILIREKNGLPVLIDFGNARISTGEKTSNVTAVLTPGYAPFEQYSVSGRQGPWTDLYSVGAVFYRSITGQSPTDAAGRINGSDMQPLAASAIPGYSMEFLQGIDKALQLRAEDRWQSCREWLESLNAKKETQTVPVRPIKPQPVRRKPVAGLILLGGVVLALGAAGTVALLNPSPNPKPKPDEQQTSHSDSLQKAREALKNSNPREAIALFLQAAGSDKKQADSELAACLSGLLSGFPASLIPFCDKDAERPHEGFSKLLDQVLAAGLATKEANQLKQAIEARNQQVDEENLSIRSRISGSKWLDALKSFRAISSSHDEYHASLSKAATEIADGLVRSAAQMTDPVSILTILDELAKAGPGYEGVFPNATWALVDRACGLAEDEPSVNSGLAILSEIKTRYPQADKVRKTADEIGERIAKDHNQFASRNPFRRAKFFLSEKSIDIEKLKKAALLLDSPVLKRELASFEPNRAEDWLSQAAKGDDPSSKVRYASILQPWAAPGKDPVKARALLEDAWKSKFPDAGVLLARMEIEGLGGKSANPQNALIIMEKVIGLAGNDGDALFMYARALEACGRDRNEYEPAYKKATLYRPGMLSIINFDSVKIDTRRYYDPFLRLGKLDEPEMPNPVDTWFVRGSMFGSTYSGHAACQLFDLKLQTINLPEAARKHPNNIWNKAGREFWLLGSVMFALGEKNLEERMLRNGREQGRMEELTGEKLFAALEAASKPPGPDTAGWCYLYGMLALKNAADAEETKPALAESMNRKAALYLGLAAKYKHSLAERWLRNEPFKPNACFR